jgi:hypothetical protein
MWYRLGKLAFQGGGGGVVTAGMHLDLDVKLLR